MFKTYQGLDSIPAGFAGCAVAIGNFDGVHLGHQRILTDTLARAKEARLPAVVLSFDPHPMKIVAPERAPAAMMTPEQRARCMEALGLDAVVMLQFTPEIARLSPADFAQRVLAERLRVRWVIVGQTFKFGHRQAGDCSTLRGLGPGLGFQLHVTPPVLSAGRPISSTRIRDLVRAGRVGAARRMLGRSYSLTGSIVTGRGVGTRQTVPTLNLSPDAELVPAQGVYVTMTRDAESGRRWDSITNIGVRPTFGGGEQSIETHLLSQQEGPPLRRIELILYRRLRDERRFGSAGQLRAQILNDVDRAQRFFRRLEVFGGRAATIP